jgi:ATP-dependent helicase/DNAse subunit B
MAYFSQEKKAKIAPAIKAILKKYNLKGSLAVRHHSSVVLNIKAGAIDFIGNYNTEAFHNEARQVCDGHIDVNPYHYEKHFSGTALDALTELFEVLNTDNFDKSDIQTDYFHVGHYVDVNIGKWDKPYELA